MCYNNHKTNESNWSGNNSQNYRSKRDEPYHQNGSNNLYKCNQCLKTFDYQYSLIRHNHFDHPNTAPNNNIKTDAKVEEVIVENDQLHAIYMNVNSIIAKNRTNDLVSRLDANTVPDITPIITKIP